jgi:hypothetical protein
MNKQMNIIQAGAGRRWLAALVVAVAGVVVMRGDEGVLAAEGAVRERAEAVARDDREVAGPAVWPPQPEPVVAAEEGGGDTPVPWWLTALVRLGSWLTGRGARLAMWLVWLGLAALTGLPDLAGMADAMA